MRDLLVDDRELISLFVAPCDEGLALVASLRKSTARRLGQSRAKRAANDAYCRLESIVDSLGQATRFGYDLMSNLTSVTDAKGQKTTFEYDDVGRVTTMHDPLGGAEVYDYTPTGRLRTRTDRKAVTTTYSYDALGRLTSSTTTTPEPFRPPTGRTPSPGPSTRWEDFSRKRAPSTEAPCPMATTWTIGARR